MRISQKNENQRWPQNSQQTPPHGPQTIVRVNKKFPKSARVLQRAHFLNLLKNGRHFSGNEVRMEFRRQSKNLVPKLGITVSRRYGKAHERNRFKRVVREAFRELYPSLPTDLELNISPKKSHPELTMMCILTDLKKFIEKLLS
jgi:ribonuclease P protein component